MIVRQNLEKASLNSGIQRPLAAFKHSESHEECKARVGVVHHCAWEISANCLVQADGRCLLFLCLGFGLTHPFVVEPTMLSSSPRCAAIDGCPPYLARFSQMVA
jgi:hypothetical protein